MMPSDGRNSLQRHLREPFSKTKSYDDLEEELFAELQRREADGDKTGSGGVNQLSESEKKKENEKEESWPELTWQDVWSPECGWVQALQENKRP